MEMYPPAVVMEQEAAPFSAGYREANATAANPPTTHWDRDALLAGGQSKIVLHVGSGPANPAKLNRIFHSPEWREVRLDIDPAVKPDIVGSIVDMGSVPDGAVDAVWSSHNLEHLYAHEVPIALSEFARVLRPGGTLLVTLPDLKAASEVIVRGDISKPIYWSTDGKVPITALDMVYGWGAQIAGGRTYMAHRTGFTAEILGNAILGAGFPQVQLKMGERLDLWALAFKGATIVDRTLLSRAVGTSPTSSLPKPDSDR